MEQYISKSALVAEIENLLDKGKYHEEYDCAYRDGNNGALYALKSKLNTFEVKEVNLEKEMDEYFENNPQEFFRDDYLNFAKHFFKLALSLKNS